MDAYSEEDILKDDFFSKWLKDNKFDPAEVSGKSEGFFGEQRANYNKLRQDTLVNQSKAKTDKINKDHEQMVKLLTSNPGRSANILT